MTNNIGKRNEYEEIIHNLVFTACLPDRQRGKSLLYDRCLIDEVEQ